MRATRRRGGWMLIEAVLILVLLGLFTLLASRLFIGLARVERDAREGQRLSTVFDSVLHTLRQDAWAASEIGGGDGTLVLDVAGAGEVVWTFGADGVTRQTPEGLRHWPDLAMPYELAVRPGYAVLRVGQHTADARPASFVLTSGVLAIGGAR